MTRMEKWANKRAEIEKEAKEIADAIMIEDNTKVFDEMMGSPVQVLEDLFNTFNTGSYTVKWDGTK